MRILARDSDGGGMYSRVVSGSSRLKLAGAGGAGVLLAAAVLCLPAFVAAAEPALPVVDSTAAPDGSFVRITLDGGVSPFTVVSWDVTVRGSTVIVSLVKENLCQTGQRERVRLLEGNNAASLLAVLKEAGAWTCQVPGVATAGRSANKTAPADQPRYEVWSAWGRSMVRYHLTQAALREAPCALRVISSVTAEVRARLDTLPMRDLYYPAEKLGWVTMTASEPASATIDGWDTVQLPVDALQVVEGEHQVVVTGESGRIRQFMVHVAPGLTQRIHVVLEQQAPDE